MSLKAQKPARGVRVKQKENTMAKNEKQDALSKADVLAALNANSARKGGRRLKDRNYTVKNEWTAEELAVIHLGPQARTCVGVILGLEVEAANEQELFAAFSDPKVVEEFPSTKQTPWEVFNYYRKKIVEAGFLTEITA
jgi:hypothetical protein